MSFQILTDTCANLPYEMVSELGLDICSLLFISEGETYYSYKEGENVDLEQFYEMMRNKKVFTTSQINPGEFKDFFCKYLDQGKDILYIGFSSGLSGMMQSAVIAKAELDEEYPDRKIILVDTLCAALGEGVIVHYAANMQKEGKSIEEVASWVEENKLRLCHWFTVDDLMFLSRGGRVSATSAIVGTIVGVKPVMHVDNEGKLILMDKVRGRKQSIRSLVDHMEKTITNPDGQIVGISHGDCIEDAEYLKKLISEKYNFSKIIVNCLDPVIGSHSGPGTLALFFLGSER
ncbi:MAG: DegV family protein [Eubacteriales bacterium]|nr:DegV family protein [Eubacteriales bacterium]